MPKYTEETEWVKSADGYTRRRSDGMYEWRPRRWRFSTPTLSPLLVQLVGVAIVVAVLLLMGVGLLLVIRVLPGFRIG